MLLKQQLSQCCSLLQNILRAEHAIQIPQQFQQWLLKVDLLDSDFLSEHERAHY